MAIRRGITLITGDAYHGKSTILEAVREGVYNHVSGDGREYVITDSSAMNIRSEDGRSIKNSDISFFACKDFRIDAGSLQSVSQLYGFFLIYNGTNLRSEFFDLTIKSIYIAVA